MLRILWSSLVNLFTGWGKLMLHKESGLLDCNNYHQVLGSVGSENPASTSWAWSGDAFAVCEGCPCVCVLSEGSWHPL